MIGQVSDVLGADDIVIDGGNSKWTHDARTPLAQRGQRFLDCGVSGGVWGLDSRYALMVGRSPGNGSRRQPLFGRAQARGRVRVRPRGRGGRWALREDGPQRHRVRTHAGLLPGLQGRREGRHRRGRAGGVPVVGEGARDPVVAARPDALDDDPRGAHRGLQCADSGEGRWTVNAAVDLGVPVPTISAALFARFVSQQADSPSMKMVAAMRNQFGGHAVKAEGPGA